MESNFKGIVLAGGHGTRLFPITEGVSKQLLPIYDKPMIYYPISVLMLAGIREILLISTPEDITSFKRLLGDGSNLGISIEYRVQDRPEGLGQAFILGEEFIGDGNVALILGDNIFYGPQFSKNLMSASSKLQGASIFGYHVKDPERFGVMNFDKKGELTSIEEKPIEPKSNYAVTGLYFYDNDVIDIAKSLKPSKRGELEITDINNVYLERGDINVELLERGFAWLDTGTIDSLIEAGHFIKTLEESQGLKVACLEEISFRNKWINEKDLLNRSNELRNTNYGKYLASLMKN